MVTSSPVANVQKIPRLLKERQVKITSKTTNYLRVLGVESGFRAWVRVPRRVHSGSIGVLGSARMLARWEVNSSGVKIP